MWEKVFAGLKTGSFISDQALWKWKHMIAMERETTLKIELARTFSYIYDSTYPLYLQFI